MVLLLRSIKLLVKLFIILFVLSILLTCQSNYGKESGKCQIWRRAWKNKNMKYILVWTNTSEEFLILKTEQDVFIENRCKYTNCYVTRERKFSECNTVDIDAIIINRKNKPEDLPTRKSHPNQTFVYATQESSANYPICNDRYNNYFNMTWTYKLDSDIVWAYFIILDNNGSQVAPSRNVKWETYDKKLSNEAGRRIIKKKRNTAVWYVSNCYTQSRRGKFVMRLAQALKVYGHGMHTMGDCGERKCPKENEEECMKILERYYFYLSLENSLAEDYVTEKVSKVLQHNTVPIVFGGANYSRFLPPGSYINGRELGPTKTAELMSKLIRNMTAYLEYFTWHNYYTINLTQQYVCELCEWLNKGKRNTYPDFLDWWNPTNTSCNNTSQNLEWVPVL